MRIAARDSHNSTGWGRGRQFKQFSFLLVAGPTQETVHVLPVRLTKTIFV